MSNEFFSYTNRDYESSRQEGISKIPVYSRGTWTDTNISDPGIIILNYVHALVDMIQYYQDHNALEVYLSTAKERKNIFRLAKQLGYEINSSKGATADVTFSVDKSYNTSFIIPKYTKISTKKSPIIDYLTLEDTIVYTGLLSVDVPCMQGNIGKMTYKGTGKSSLDNSLEPEDQSITLPVTGVDISTISITDSDGGLWKSTDYIVFSEKDEKLFEPRLSYDGKVKIQFGSGERGYSPKATDELYITYIYNEGSNGKVGANELTEISFLNTGSLSDISYNSGTLIGNDGETRITGLTATNKLPSTGGTDPESSKDIVNNAPAVIKTNDRAVTLEDYEILAKRVSGVKKAIAYDIKNAPEMCLHYEVKVLIIPDSGEVTSTLRNNVYNYLSSKSIPPVVLTILSPKYQPIDITAKIIIENNYYEDDVKYNIIKLLENYFEELSSTLNVEIIPNQLISMISTVKGVRYVEELTPSSTINIPKLTIATLGEVNLDLVRRNS